MIRMKVLVTAGNTWAPIDKVRVLTNIFTGKTGASIADEAMRRNHSVTLLTSQPDIAERLWSAERGAQSAEQDKSSALRAPRSALHKYRTFDELRELMATHIRSGSFNAVIHSAAVSDYLAGGVYSSSDMKPASPLPQTAKIKSAEPELWLRLVRAPKLVDLVRGDWQFGGVLVKFKLEAGADDKSLLDIAERSRLQSKADLMVANTLEGAGEWAYLGPLAAGYQRIPRSELAERLLDAVEHLHKERGHA